jgi:hypothetical protein
VARGRRTRRRPHPHARAALDGSLTISGLGVSAQRSLTPEAAAHNATSGLSLCSRRRRRPHDGFGDDPRLRRRRRQLALRHARPMVAGCCLRAKRSSALGGRLAGRGSASCAPAWRSTGQGRRWHASSARAGRGRWR